MSWRQAVGISAFCFGGANVNAVRCASPTGLNAAIPRELVSNISSGWTRMANICRCSGRLFGIRNPGRHGLTSNTKEAAALGVSPSEWFWKRHNLRDCSERTNTRLVWRSCRDLNLGRVPAPKRVAAQHNAHPHLFLLLWKPPNRRDTPPAPDYPAFVRDDSKLFPRGFSHAL